METNDLFTLWAKTKRNDPETYHPLICHLIDVASVARVLWARVAPSSLRGRVSRGLGMDDPQGLSAWISFLAGLHDIGKASPGFQAKHVPGWTRVTAAGFSAPLEPRDLGHGTVSAIAIQELLLMDKFGSLPRRVLARFIAGAVGGHHGVFPSASEVMTANVEAVRGGPDWAAARREIALMLARQTGVDAYPGPQSIDATTATILAGLISVADWIGSDERFFAYSASNGGARVVDLDDYAQHAREASVRALDELGWLDWTPDATELSLTDLFPFISQPRPVQEAVTELTQLTRSPGIAIIEVPMGEGKTEAAFFLADRWSTSAGQNGAYVAMPTMATSNQMFGRMREFLARRYSQAIVNLQLLHSQAALSMELEAQETGDDQAIKPTEVHDDRVGQVVAREWFTRRKRGLLAPFGVGTVDQALLGVLSTPHHFVRLFGLAGKTVVFDEVHAYDVYMTTLFERLMTWLGALGSSVVVLSATLPDQRRRALLDAYADGAGIEVTSAQMAATYPRLSWAGPNGTGVREVETSDDIRRELSIGWIGNASTGNHIWEPVVGWLQATLSDGGCAAVICNSVRSAQEVYQALKPAFAGVADDGEPELDLLHARFPFEERDMREKRALRRFGKPGGTVSDEHGASRPVLRPRRAVLVATQVIEQSLDLDFDVMVSEVAPIDLLLQRSGRLHRHSREARPAGLERPCLWLIRPNLERGIPKFTGATPLIYNSHILFRTWLALRETGKIAVPEDIGALIETVYDRDGDAPADLSPDQREYWESTRMELEEQLRFEAEQARVRAIPRPEACERIAELTQHFRAEDSPDLHTAHQALTRLGGPSVSLICLHQTPQGLALHADGREVVDPHGEPDTASARRLLRRSVTVSLPSVAPRLLRAESHPAWRRSSLLRHHRLAVFGPDSRATVGDVQLRLDPELGLLIE